MTDDPKDDVESDCVGAKSCGWRTILVRPPQWHEKNASGGVNMQEKEVKRKNKTDEIWICFYVIYYTVLLLTTTTINLIPLNGAAPIFCFEYLWNFRV